MINHIIINIVYLNGYLNPLIPVIPTGAVIHVTEKQRMIHFSDCKCVWSFIHYTFE